MTVCIKKNVFNRLLSRGETKIRGYSAIRAEALWRIRAQKMLSQRQKKVPCPPKITRMCAVTAFSDFEVSDDDILSLLRRYRSFGHNRHCFGRGRFLREPFVLSLVDMVKLGLAVTQMSTNGDSSAFMNTGRAIAMLKDYGYIVLDSRMVIAAPDEYVKTPQQLIPGAPDMTDAPGGYVPPDIVGAGNALRNKQ